MHCTHIILASLSLYHSGYESLMHYTVAVIDQCTGLFPSFKHLFICPEVIITLAIEIKIAAIHDQN